VLSGLGEQFEATMANQEVLVSSRIPVSDEVVNIVISVPVITADEGTTTDAGATDATNAAEGEPATTEEPAPVPGKVVGTLGVIIRMEQLEQVILPLARGTTDIAIVRGNNEIFLATAGVRSDPATWLTQTSIQLDLARNGGTGGFAAETPDGTPLIGVYQPLLIENATWATVVTNPAPESFVQQLMSRDCSYWGWLPSSFWPWQSYSAN
jgi:hypothetical protein